LDASVWRDGREAEAYLAKILAALSPFFSTPSPTPNPLSNPLQIIIKTPRARDFD
jgi:hypothetical protein